MTVIQLCCSETGELQSCVADGHAGYATKGADIVCSAVTILMRTALQVLSDTSGVKVEYDTALPGKISFRIKQEVSDCELSGRLKCAGDFLDKGFKSLSMEYPLHVNYEKLTEA